MERQDELFFAFLRFSIGAGDMPDDMASADWSYMYDMACRQAMTGILFSGVERLPKSLRPEYALLMRWYAECRRIEKAGERADKTAAAVSRWFALHGRRSCILKGQGNALMYPEPHRRTSGDVDIWVEGKPEDIIRMVRDIDPKAEIIYHHIEFPDYKGTPVEVHYRPRFLHHIVHNRRMQRWFADRAGRQFVNSISMGGGTVCVPTDDMNIVVQTVHVYEHLLQDGIGLRQLTDYYFLLRRVHENGTDTAGMGDELRRMGLYGIASALMYVMKYVYAMPEELFIVPADRRRGQVVIAEMLAGGNFGQYDGRGRFKNTFVGHNVLRLWRDMRLALYFPGECLSEPLFRLWHFGWRMYMSRKFH